jgi:hypothetical protein
MYNQQIKMLKKNQTRDCYKLIQIFEAANLKRLFLYLPWARVN